MSDREPVPIAPSPVAALRVVQEFDHNRGLPPPDPSLSRFVEDDDIVSAPTPKRPPK